MGNSMVFNLCLQLVDNLMWWLFASVFLSLRWAWSWVLSCFLRFVDSRVMSCVSFLILVLDGQSQGFKIALTIQQHSFFRKLSIDKALGRKCWRKYLAIGFLFAIDICLDFKRCSCDPLTMVGSFVFEAFAVPYCRLGVPDCTWKRRGARQHMSMLNKSGQS